MIDMIDKLIEGLETLGIKHPKLSVVVASIVESEYKQPLYSDSTTKYDAEGQITHIKCSVCNLWFPLYSPTTGELNFYIAPKNKSGYSTFTKYAKSIKGKNTTKVNRLKGWYLEDSITKEEYQKRLKLLEQELQQQLSSVNPLLIENGGTENVE